MAKDPIQNGVKTDRDTQPVQVRMLKSQIKVLKVIAGMEDRSTSAIIRELVDGYIRYKRLSEPDDEKRQVLQHMISITKYDEETDKVENWPYEWINGLPAETERKD